MKFRNRNPDVRIIGSVIKRCTHRGIVKTESRSDLEMEIAKREKGDRDLRKRKGTLYWELSSSLSSGISPFFVVEKYLESFRLIFAASFF